MRRAALYLRVSTKEQNMDNQRLELERIAKSRGWSVVEVYDDHGISGARGREQRPAYDRMLRDLVRSRFDVLMAWDVSRLGRSLSGLVNVLEDLHAGHVDLYLHQQALDTTTPTGRALFQMCGVFAEFERTIISERVKSGLKRARAEGKIFGRPKKIVDEESIMNLYSNGGISIRKIAEMHNLSVGKVHSIVKGVHNFVRR